MNKVAKFVIAITLVYSLSIEFVRILFPWQVDYVEGLMLYISSLIHKGFNVYSIKPSSIEFTSASYPLLSYIPTLISHLIFGIDVKSLILSRFFHMISSLTALVILSYVLYLLTRNLTLSLAYIALTLAFRPIAYWLPLVRCDNLALFFIALNFYLILKGSYTLLPLALTLLSLTKQQYLDLSLTILIWALVIKRNTRLIKALVVAIALQLIAYLLHEVAYRGTLTSLIMFNMVHVRKFSQAIAIFRYSFTELPWSIFILLMALISAGYYIVRSRNKFISLLSMYLIINFVASFIMSSKLGSNTNYYIVSASMASMVAMYSIHEFLVKAKRYLRVLLIMSLILISLLSIQCTSNSFGFPTDERNAGLATIAILSILKPKLNASWCWCDEYLIAYLLNLYVPVDAFYYTQLVRASVLADITYVMGGLPKIIIWSYDTHRITDGVLHLILNHTYRILLPTNYFGVFIQSDSTIKSEMLDIVESYSRYLAIYSTDSITRVFSLIEHIVKNVEYLMNYLILAFLALMCIYIIKYVLKYVSKRLCRVNHM